MALGEPVETRVAKSHQAYLSGVVTIPSMLDAAGVAYRRCLPDEKLSHVFVYILKVPSLNMPGMNHFILADGRQHLTEFTIYDPVAGKPGKKVYTYNPDDCEDKNYKLLEAFTPYILFETPTHSDLKLRYQQHAKKTLGEGIYGTVPSLQGAYVSFNKLKRLDDFYEDEMRGIILQTYPAYALVLTALGTLEEVPLTAQNHTDGTWCSDLKILQLSSEF
jgi:hypothetical protein